MLIMNSIKFIELKQKIDIFISDKGFFALHNHSYGVKKDKIWGEKIILQPIMESLNEFYN